MKLKQNLFLKILAFLLAVLMFAVAAAMTIYQMANFSVLWEDYSTFYGFTIQQKVWEDYKNIEELIDLANTDNLGTYAQWELEDLKLALAIKNTNLRWQGKAGGQVKYGNTSEELPNRTDFAVYVIDLAGAKGYEYGELIMWLAPDLPVEDEYKTAVQTLTLWKEHRIAAVVCTAVCALLGLLCTIYLCVTCGHKKGKDGIYISGFHHIPGDLLLAAYIFGFVLLCIGVGECFDPYHDWPFRWSLALATACITGMAVLVISFLVTFVARCKGRVVLRYTVIGCILICTWHICKAVANAIPLIWKVALTGMAYFIFSIILAVNCRWIGSFWVVIWVLVTLAVIVYLCWWALQWKRVRQGAREIISGNTGYQIDNKRMPTDLKTHSDELNNLGQAIGVAVEERLRSEHFKAELITNVSHDLKTPLTSIISYVDLLKKENIENPKAQEYIEVLDRKSQRLKKLTEDLVEASKASTGALNVSRERLDLNQLVDQALGEYEQRLTNHGLTVVRTLPPQPVWVEADGRHMWRVVDNLLSNCVKYALKGTRIYVEVQELGDCARLSVKNISREELNIPADRLTERFVRGDESRTMEGSGLGLSIAQSLTDLQHGVFDIAIDGDLFKVAVTLPLAPETELL